MSIYIEGMDMPTSGELLVIITPNGEVKYKKSVASIWDRTTAVHVPPHGDLIERDALTISTAVPLDGKPYQYVHIDNIKGAPTIIAADADEERREM